MPGAVCIRCPTLKTPRLPQRVMRLHLWTNKSAAWWKLTPVDLFVHRCSPDALLPLHLYQLGSRWDYLRCKCWRMFALQRPGRNMKIWRDGQKRRCWPLKLQGFLLCLYIDLHSAEFTQKHKGLNANSIDAKQSVIHMWFNRWFPLPYLFLTYSVKGQWVQLHKFVIFFPGLYLWKVENCLLVSSCCVG